MLALPFAQIPIFVTAFAALRQLAGVGGNTPYPDFATGGALWFTNLCQPDETWLLPFACSALYLLNTEVSSKLVIDWYHRLFPICSLDCGLQGAVNQIRSKALYRVC